MAATLRDEYNNSCNDDDDDKKTSQKTPLGGFPVLKTNPKTIWRHSTGVIVCHFFSSL